MDLEIKKMLRFFELSYQSKGERLPTFKQGKFINIVNFMFYYPIKQPFMYDHYIDIATLIRRECSLESSAPKICKICLASGKYV